MTTESAHRFAFGENWKSFSNTVSNDEINEAVNNLKRVLQEERVEQKSFLDVGCGSGLHSLAAVRLGMKTVSAFDIDEQSVETTKKLLSTYASGFSARIEQKSIFNATPVDEQDKYDIVYSWGVLHHTGNMWEAIKKASRFVAPDGKFIIAIYKKTPSCGFWRAEKSIYSRLPSILQTPITALFSAFYLAGILAKGTNPVKYVKNYSGYRGMSFWHDMIDWLGGCPYESASPKEMTDFFEALGFQKIAEYNGEPVKAWGLFGSGCAEYVFSRHKIKNKASALPTAS